MRMERDLPTARLSFHMAKLFSKYPRMHDSVLMKKGEIGDAIMTCLRDRELQPLEKREALQLIPYLIGDAESI